MTLRFLKGATTLALVIIISACSSSDDDTADSGITRPADNARSASYAPVTGLNDQGVSTPLYWEYRINNGQALSVNYQNISMTLNMNNLKILINPTTFTRKVELTGSATGSVSGYSFSGTIAMNSTENLDQNAYPGATLIDHQILDIVVSGSAAGQSLAFSFETDVNFSPATEWFLDRETLDQLAIGYVYSEQNTVAFNGTFALEVTPNYLGTPVNGRTFEGTSPGLWTIADKPATVTANGEIYSNIVQVVRTVQTPDTSTGLTSESSITYWVAKGIGVVKSTGEFSLFGQALSMELVDTNLVVTAPN